MSTQVALTLHEGNDEALDLVVTADDGSDLSLITSLELVLKADTCDPDTDGLVLSSTVPAEIDILTQTEGTLTATAYIPAAALAEPYGRVWRLDALTGALRRTVMYGPVTVIDL